MDPMWNIYDKFLVKISRRLLEHKVQSFSVHVVYSIIYANGHHVFLFFCACHKFSSRRRLIVLSKNVVLSDNHVDVRIRASSCIFNAISSLLSHFEHGHFTTTVTPQQVRHMANKYLFIYEKIRFASQNTEFLNFCFFSKKSVKITSNDLETTKFCKN